MRQRHTGIVVDEAFPRDCLLFFLLVLCFEFFVLACNCPLAGRRDEAPVASSLLLPLHRLCRYPYPFPTLLVFDTGPAPEEPLRLSLLVMVPYPMSSPPPSRSLVSPFCWEKHAHGNDVERMHNIRHIASVTTAKETTHLGKGLISQLSPRPQGFCASSSISDSSNRDTRNNQKNHKTQVARQDSGCPRKSQLQG